LRIISGFEEATSGTVQIHGVDVTNTPPHLRSTNIVFQRGALFPHMNVAENIGYSLKLRKLSKAQIATRVEEMLVLVKLEGLAGRGPSELSGGQVQRVALARALASEPSVLLLDEPLSALDLKLRQHMQLELRTIQRQLGATFIYVTHDQTEALVLSDQIAVMNEGRVVQVGSPREIYANPATEFASDFIGEINLLHGTVAETADGLVHIKLATGELLAGKGSNLSVGQRATLSVRPESIRVNAFNSLDDSKFRLSGRILDIIFLGSRTRLQIEIAEGKVVLTDLDDQETVELTIGATVKLSWQIHQANVWKSESGGSQL
jgi:ABC-type Fe3+/spermidine/putrescine transport system ATPase subunit